MIHRDMLAGLIAQAAQQGADAATLRAVVEEACDLGAERVLARLGLWLRWTRRARGARSWPDEVEIPLAEQAEAYRVGIGPANSPFAVWQVGQPELLIDAATLASLRIAHPGADVWVRQIGSFAQSHPLFLTTLS